LAICFLAGGFVLTGCSRTPNDKQMAALEETNASTASAQEKVAQLEKENAELKAKLAEKQQELKAVEAEKEKVMSKVAK